MQDTHKGCDYATTAKVKTVRKKTFCICNSKWERTCIKTTKQNRHLTSATVIYAAAIRGHHCVLW